MGCHISCHLLAEIINPFVAVYEPITGFRASGLSESKKRSSDWLRHEPIKSKSARGNLEAEVLPNTLRLVIAKLSITTSLN